MGGEAQGVEGEGAVACGGVLSREERVKGKVSGELSG